ncbi:unnamed protein product [Rotaria magnacalcarata]|uniref:Uncharacterized protein n=1 Tax=Rotaria magnacalcarata TaxID=392030 RepID=A0A816UGX6_9BILA|nr:unnamed protein product [Rotaria magnacalcarata]CAF1686470.1 unnamed protein product [Rotaria magnacalcarata]CAF2098182.1 unnamed protein product [Rotaria magnacalcarata]CAF2102254.1 unnamed protein product [Rotaria magnacalcarata]CAF2232073.1 unnamed protein product [Rotaria magnacalcarata]
MIVIDWLQTREFVRENSERFLLYYLCGCFIGISIILLMVIIILYLEQRFKMRSDNQSSTRSSGYDDRNCYMPVYRYNCRTHCDVYQV